jgi:hypothetical protein
MKTQSTTDAHGVPLHRLVGPWACRNCKWRGDYEKLTSGAGLKMGCPVCNSWADKVQIFRPEDGEETLCANCGGSAEVPLPKHADPCECEGRPNAKGDSR